MKIYICISITILFVIACGCKSPDRNTGRLRVYLKDDETVVIVQPLTGPRKSKAEIQQLTKEAKAGDGKAAFALAAYYSFSEESNAKYAKKYHRLAEKLNYPYELFLIAKREWSGNPKPDLNKIEAYARKAAQAGVERADELLAEIVEARTSGVIPNETKLRLIVPN